MFLLKPRAVLRLTVIQKESIRNVAVANSAVKTNEETNQLKSWKEIPGPSSLPFVGQIMHFLPGGILHNVTGLELSEKLYNMYGPIIKLDMGFGKSPLIFLFDAESAAQVLRGENWMPIRPGFQSLEYYRKQYRKDKGKSIEATGLITDHGDVWKDFRSTVNPVMLQPKNIKLYTSVIDEVARDMITRMKSLRDNKNMLSGKFDIEMNLWSLESIGVIALGTRLNCFDPNLADDSPAKNLIKCVHDIFQIAEQLDFKPSLWRYISTPTYKKAMKIYETQDNLCKYFIKRAMEELKTNSTKSDEEKGILEKLLEINEEYAYIMASDMLLAGVDTAANTMTATLYLLATNPEKQEKLREEVMSKQEKRSYMRACIKESLRVMPIVSGNVRRSTKEYNILGYQIPKDMEVVFAHQSMSLMKNNYSRPQEFIPERWLAEKSDPLYHGNSHPFANSPFGFGVRSCIGRRIAELEIETFLARIVENFRVEWFGPRPEVASTSLNYIKGPFNFIFKDV